MIKCLIENRLIPKHEFVFGFADLRGLIHPQYSHYQFGISIGKRLDNSIIDNLLEGPTIEYYNYYCHVNKELADLSKKIQQDLTDNKIDSIAIEPTISRQSKNYYKYLRSLTYEISHKMVATRAGLGWIGKSDLLISTRFGPRLRLVTILLADNPGITGNPVNKSRCGKCNICVEKCPAHAANGGLWNIKVHRDEFFNAFKCRETCGELARRKLNVDERICGLCISVCPVGKTKNNQNMQYE